MSGELQTCTFSGCSCMNAPLARACLRCRHDVALEHFRINEFVCARAESNRLTCGSCGEEIETDDPSTTAQAARTAALADHYRSSHPELDRGGRFRERSIQGARFLFFG